MQPVAGLVKPTHDNFRVTRIALADIVFCRSAACLVERILVDDSILHEHSDR